MRWRVQTVKQTPALRIGTVLDLLFEQRRISLLILDLAVHIIPVERSTTVRLERGNHRVVSALQKRVRRTSTLRVTLFF
jgi:hypothetical protein